MGKICRFLTELPARDMPVFLFRDNNLSKYQCIFAKLGMCIDIVDIWFGIANGQNLLIFNRVTCSRHVRDNNLSKYQCIFAKLGMCIAIVLI